MMRKQPHANSEQVIIRFIEDDEVEGFHEAGSQAFPAAVAPLVQAKEITLVAVEGGQIVGGFAAESVELKGQSKMAVVRWLFVLPSHQGLSIGARLARRGIECVKEQGFDYFVSDIDGDNTSSFRIVESLGARLIRPWEQIRLLGLRGMGSAWWKLSHFMDFGHFIYAWTDDDPTENDSGVARSRGGQEFLVSSLACASIAAVAGWRSGLAVGWVATAVLLLLVMRQVVTWLASRVQGLSVRHRAWDSGYPFSLLLAIAAGVYFPMPGGIYPSHEKWRAKDEITRRGRSAMAAMVVLMAIVGAARWAEEGEFARPWQAAVEALIFVGVPTLLFGAVVAFAPFACFHAKRIRDWRTAAWICCAIPALVICFWPLLA